MIDLNYTSCVFFRQYLAKLRIKNRLRKKTTTNAANIKSVCIWALALVIKTLDLDVANPFSNNGA